MDAAVPTPLWPLGIYFAAVVFLSAGMVLLSNFLGPRHRDLSTDLPYEGGIISTGSAHLRLSIQYYMIAMFFVIFDLEAVFIIAWAIAFRQVGWAGFVEVAIFIGILLATLAYLWRLGALDWSPHKQMRTAMRDAAQQPGNRNGAESQGTRIRQRAI